MKKLNKVIVGLECCLSDADCDKCCPYFKGEYELDGCMAEMMADALEVLKSVEPVVHAHWVAEEGISDGYHTLTVSSCSNCGGQVSHHDYACPDKRCKHCGAHMDEEVADGK